MLQIWYNLPRCPHKMSRDQTSEDDMRKMSIISTILLTLLSWNPGAHADPAFAAWVQEVERAKIELSAKIKKVWELRQRCLAQKEEPSKALCKAGFDVMATRYEAHIDELSSMITAVSADQKLRALYLMIVPADKYSQEEARTSAMVNALAALFAEPAATGSSTVGQSTPTLKPKPAAARKKQ